MAKSGQNVPSKCYLDQFLWEWALIGDLFFSALFCLGLGLVFFFLPIPWPLLGQTGDFSESQRFRLHFFCIFYAFFCIFSAFFHRAQTAFPPPPALKAEFHSNFSEVLKPKALADPPLCSPNFRQAPSIDLNPSLADSLCSSGGFYDKHLRRMQEK